MNRASALGVLVGIALLTPAPATADTNPALGGSCAGTLGGGPGESLTLDAGAAVNAPGVLAVGTGSDSAGQATVSLPLADAAKTLNVGNAPVAGQAATKIVCPAGQAAVNALSSVAQGLLGAKPGNPGNPGTPPGSSPQPPAGAPNPGTGSAPGNTPGSSALVSFPLAGTDDSATVVETARLAGPSGAAREAEPPLVVEHSGSAQAAPETSPARLPLLLATFALVLVAAALARSWVRRNA